MRRKIVALIAASAFAAGPVAAQAQSAAPLSIAAAARAGAETRDANEYRGGVILPTLAIVAIIALLAATNTFPFGGGDAESP